MATAQRIQRTLLLSVIASVGAFALAGICVLAVGAHGGVGEKILGTTAVSGGGSLAALAAFLSWPRRVWWCNTVVGAVASGLAVCLTLTHIWMPYDVLAVSSDFTAMCWFFAVACAHTGLLSTARLRREHEWCRIATLAVVLALTCVASVLAISNHFPDEWERLVGILAILSVSGTVAVFALHLMSGIRSQPTLATTIAGDVHLTCPRCGLAQSVPLGRSECGGCKLKLRIEIDEERCPTCGYPLYQLESNVCPECGTPIAGPSAAANEPRG